MKEIFGENISPVTPHRTTGQVGQGAGLEEVRTVEHGLSLYYGFHGMK